MANRNLSCVILLGGLSVNLNHLKRQIVWNDNEEWAENLCKRRKCRLSGMIIKNGLKICVKKNTQIVWNDNKEWAENLCKKEHTDCLE